LETKKWRNYTFGSAAILVAYGAANLFSHKISWLVPTNLWESIQFTAGKLIIFFVLSYFLILCARNFLSHKHNAIINRHRQHALMTFKALVEAAERPEISDIVLHHAAQCIYAPQETGYIKAGDSGRASNTSVIEMVPRTVIQADQ